MANRLGANICEKCATLGNCDECGALHVYPYCVDVGTFECCGQNLCGGEDEHEGSCTDRHIVEKLDCGHEGCNYYGGACLSYENEKASKVEKESVKGDIASIYIYLSGHGSNQK